MASKTFFTILILAAYASAIDIQHVRSSRARPNKPVDLPEAQFVVSLTEKVPRPSFKKQMLRELCGGGSLTIGSLAGTSSDEEYVTDVTIGGQHFKAIVDTGSSDTWLAAKGFNCFTLENQPVPPSDCSFGSAGFDVSQSKTFVSLPDTNFNITYGDHEFLTGTAGFDTVTIAGLTVKHQEIALVTKAAWLGDKVSTGLIGLAYPTLTSVYNGTDPDLDSRNNSLPYNPFFFSAVQQKAVKAPIFSVALDRGTFKEETNSTLTPNLGVIAFGGIAPVPVTETQATIPIQAVHTSSGRTEILWYTVDVDSYVFPNSSSLNTTSQAILDTGTTLNYFPTHIAEAFNAQFVPPATLNETDGLYHVDCDAQAPPLSVTLGGVQFVVDRKDSVVPSLDTNNNVYCVSGTQDGGAIADGSIFVLGDTFLHNVVATFNIEANQVTLSQRVKY